MVSRVVVTGVNGFVGQHLARELVEHGHEVVGLGHETESRVAGLAEYVVQDLTDAWPAALEADAVIHLAGLSAVGPSFAHPQRYLTINSAMLTHLGEALLAERSRARVLVISSGAVYDADQPLPLDEDARVMPSSPYVVSKLLVESQAAYYAQRGLDLVVARPFNHVGPGQGPGFLVPDLWAAASDAATEGQRLRVGDLGTRRDYTDVRDVVRAYRLLVEADRLSHRIFNVCSGRSWSGRELLAELTQHWPFGDLPVAVDSARIRPGDPQDVRGDARRIAGEVGWRPQIGIPAAIADFAAALRGSRGPG